jgi:Uma2 family endonuclease
VATQSLPIDIGWTAADLALRVGPVPLSRIRLVPFPGTATEEDVLEVQRKEGLLCELVDGVLVEKPVGTRESAIACLIVFYLRQFLVGKSLGTVLGADGMLRLFPNLVRIPDVSFLTWESFPGRRLPSDAIALAAPDLAVEVLSPSNTTGEMEQKRREYFAAGTRLVWIVDPATRTIDVYDSLEHHRRLDRSSTLDGGTVLPGFSLAVSSVFAELDPQP